MTGVKFVPRGEDESYEVGVGREVVLSAGAIHTPQVLQLSGIGPAAWLEAAGVDVRVDLPGVGANFQDHPIGPNIGFSCKCSAYTPVSMGLRTLTRKQGARSRPSPR